MSATAIITKSLPFGKNAGKDALDLALLFGSYEQQISLFFIGDGVYHLLQNQTPEKIGAKDYISTYKALAFYDIENVYVCKESLNQRGLLSNENILADAQILDKNALTNALNHHNTVYTF